MDKNTKRRLISLALASILTFTQSGCRTELAGDTDSYDILDTNSDLENSQELRNGIKQVIPVEGEDFNLVIEYFSTDPEWRITANKSLSMIIYTQGLNGKNVYIDTIHMDTSIVSTNAYYDGIKQDTLDDHIHNSLLIGFPITDTNSYFGVNEIEGQNSEFIEGFSYGYNGYHSSSVTSKRRLESDFLEAGVWANKIDGVVGLLIEDQTTGQIRGVDVPTTILVKVNNQITFEKNDSYVTYEYNEYGNKEKVNEIPKQKTKTKIK